jgi:hypothetical protein
MRKTRAMLMKNDGCEQSTISGHPASNYAEKKSQEG